MWVSIEEFNSLKVGTKRISIHSGKIYKIKSKRNKDKWCTNGDFFYF